MTLWEFAIARHLAQLLAESEARELTEKEIERLEVLGRRVEVYEGREISRRAPARRGNSAGRGINQGLDTSLRGEPRPADQAQV